jgi:uncharacterized membrane protein
MKTTKIILLFFIFSLLTTNVSAKDYSLGKADLNYTIYDNGRISVAEAWTYNLQGCFNELFIQKPPYFIFEGQTNNFELMDSSGYCINAECAFRTAPSTSSISGDNELILGLGSTNCDRTVTAVFSYDIKQIIIGNDTAQFYYKLWGDKVDKPVPLSVTLNLPGNAAETQYTIHPWDLKTGASQSGNKITITSSQPASTFLEINLLMPKNWFKTDNQENYYISQRSKEQIISAENSDKKNFELIKSIVEPLIILLSIVTFLSPIILFIGIYLLLGRERRAEDLGYHEQAYERDPPSKHLPEEAAFFLEGKYSDRSFVAGIMNLIYKKYLDIDERGKDVFILLKKEADDQLKEHQKKLLEIIKYKAAGKQEINFKEFSKTEYNSGLAHKYEEWKIELVKETNINQYLERKGSAVYAISVFVSFVILVLIGSLLSSFTDSELVGILMFSTFASFFTGIILLIISFAKPALLGRWTKEGRLLNLKQKNFKKYLEDFSYLKEHPPESVKIWDYFMAYAIAFGVAEKTLKAMKTQITTEQMRSSGIRSPLLMTYPSFYNYHAANHISTAAQSSHSSGGGGFGGSGGGGGGGGGGAR